MKILAIEKTVDDVSWKNQDVLLKEEAAYVLKLKNDGVVKEIYFTENHDAVLILESDSLEDGKELLNTFPLVKSKMICFEVHALLRYDGFDRLD